MKELFANSVFMGVCITLASYALGVYLKKRSGWALMNPLLISIVLTIAFLLLADIDSQTYNRSCQPLTFLLTPATVSLAVPLYRQFQLLKRNSRAVMAGLVSGVVSSIFSVFLLALAFGFNHREYVTFLPKSITTAIGLSVSETLGGIVPVTVIVIVLTGVVGNIFAEKALKLFRIEEPIAKGIAIGSAAHAMGTSKAMEMGETEGAMSSLSIVVCGILTVLVASLCSNLIPA